VRKGARASGGDDPGRDGGVEALGEEGAEGLVLPGLEVAGGPVVEQAVAGDVVFGSVDRNGAAKVVAGAYPDAEFELEVEIAGWAKGRSGFGGELALAAGTVDLFAGGSDGRAAAVVADGYPLVVGQQGLIGAEEFADVGGVVDSGVEVGVVADGGGEQQFAIGGGMKQVRIFECAGGQKSGDLLAQSDSWLAA
jgi:hypothetical protein